MYQACCYPNLSPSFYPQKLEELLIKTKKEKPTFIPYFPSVPARNCPASSYWDTSPG